MLSPDLPIIKIMGALEKPGCLPVSLLLSRKLRILGSLDRSDVDGGNCPRVEDVCCNLTSPEINIAS